MTRDRCAGSRTQHLAVGPDRFHRSLSTVIRTVGLWLVVPAYP
jgi:hypothetical protein